MRPWSLLLVVLAAAGAAPPEKPVTLAPGRFGQALDARAVPVIIDPSDRYRQPPLTVECWAKLFHKDRPNVLVSNDPKKSYLHWEIFSAAGSGAFAAYLPGRIPAEIVSDVNICDGEWHYLAMTYDGQTVRLFVDGRLVKQQVTIRSVLGLTSKDHPPSGPLMIGLAVDGDQRIGCDGLIDDVRLSRGVRAIKGVPTAELPLDPPTIGLWRFDAADAPSADPAWTPRPAVGNAPSWEKETDADWTDGRLRRMDTGPTFNATIDYPTWEGKTRSFKATAIKVGDRGEAAVLFDRNQLRLAAGWTGGFLQHSDRRFGLLNTPKPDGPLTFTTARGPGWAGPDGEWNAPTPATGPLPREWARYKGLYLHGPHVVLAYTVGGADVLDSSWVESGTGGTVFTRTVEIGPSDNTLRMLACDLSAGPVQDAPIDGVPVLAAHRDNAWSAVALVAGNSAAKLELASQMRAVVVVPPGKAKRRFQVLLWQGAGPDLPAFARRAKAGPPPPDLAAWTKPGPARWTQPVVTRGEVARDDAPFVIDTLTVPYENPYRALMFLSGLDFLPNGDIAVCTAHGDVWIVSGADAKLDRLVWKRFATGLYQPLGLKVVDGIIHVLERGQLTRLHDRNGDSEADYYEDLNSDWHTGPGEHSYDTCLETDPQGNFYFFKTGDPETPTGGCLLRVSKDGTKSEVFATGFRHPIGLGVGPGGTVTGADQEGNWMPATRIDVYRRGGFYGDLRTHHRPAPPATFDPPLCWLPQEADNSAGGQVWVPPGRFGPLAGQLLHLSYGRCKLLLLLRQEVDGQPQGGAVDLGLFFLSGVMRGRFHPADGHLYVAGLRGWQTAARRDGCLQRVRYTGRPLKLPLGLSVHTDGLRLTFSQSLDRMAAEDVANWRVEQWNYRWSGDYGSKRWSVAQSQREGQDAVPVASAKLSADGRTVYLHLREVRPVMQMEIDYHLRTAAGEPLHGVVFNTVHGAAPPGRAD